VPHSIFAQVFMASFRKIFDYAQHVLEVLYLWYLCLSNTSTAVQATLNNVAVSKMLFKESVDMETNGFNA